MKKIISLLIATIMALALFSCNDNSNGAADTQTNETIQSTGNQNDDILEDATNKESNVPYETEYENDEIEASSDNNSTSNEDWRQFLKDYEAWVDDYIAIVKKYKDNPADMSILSDYTEMVSEMTNWVEKADKIELELDDTDAALEYSAELLRIAAKLGEAAY